MKFSVVLTDDEIKKEFKKFVREEAISYLREMVNDEVKKEIARKVASISLETVKEISAREARDSIRKIVLDKTNTILENLVKEEISTRIELIESAARHKMQETLKKLGI